MQAEFKPRNTVTLHTLLNTMNSGLESECHVYLPKIKMNWQNVPKQSAASEH